MKKHLIILITAITLFSIFLFPLGEIIKVSQEFNFQTSNIDEDAIIFTYDYIDSPGFTKDEIAQIQNTEHVINTQFFNNDAIYNSFALATVSGELNNIGNNYHYYNDNNYAYGNQLLNVQNNDQNLNYVYGGPMEKTNDIVIDEQFANMLLSSSQFEGLSEEELIGQKLVSSGEVYTLGGKNMTYTISGIYKKAKNNDSYHYSGIGYSGDIKSIYNNINIDNAFYTQYDSLEYKGTPKAESINLWNRSQNQVNSYYDDYENSIYDKDGNFLYDKAIESGIEGLIDPQSDEYPDLLNDGVIIQVDDPANKEAVIKTMESIFDVDSVTYNGSSLGLFHSLIPSLIIYFGFFIFIFTFIFRNYFKKASSIFIRNFTIILMISAIISPFICFLASHLINIYVIPMIIILLVAFINSLILFILSHAKKEQV